MKCFGTVLRQKPTLSKWVFSALVYTLALWSSFFGRHKLHNEVPVRAILAEHLWRACQHLLYSVAFASMFELMTHLFGTLWCVLLYWKFNWTILYTILSPLSLLNGSGANFCIFDCYPSCSLVAVQPCLHKTSVLSIRFRIDTVPLCCQSLPFFNGVSFNSCATFFLLSLSVSHLFHFSLATKLNMPNYSTYPYRVCIPCEGLRKPDYSFQTLHIITNNEACCKAVSMTHIHNRPPQNVYVPQISNIFMHICCTEVFIPLCIACLSTIKIHLCRYLLLGDCHLKSLVQDCQAWGAVCLCVYTCIVSKQHCWTP